MHKRLPSNALLKKPALLSTSTKNNIKEVVTQNIESKQPRGQKPITDSDSQLTEDIR